MYRSVSVGGGGVIVLELSTMTGRGVIMYMYGEYGDFSAFCWTRGKTTRDCPPSPAH